MSIRPVFRLLAVVFAASVGVAVLSAQSAPPQQSPQVFRAGTTVIPIDVRVLDSDGKPITNLAAADFTVLENNRPQKVEYFSSRQLTPADPDSSGSVRLSSTSLADPLKQQNRRVFLIVLGRGRLQEPSKGVDATLRFVRERLLPQDQVALMAWNRATDFTTDHQRVAELIERFKRYHEGIEALMVQRFSGLGGYYGGAEIPQDIQIMIDRVFGGARAGTSREVLPSQSLGRAAADARQTADLIIRSEVEAFRAFGGADVRLADAMIDPTLPLSFDDYVALNRQTMQDVGNLYAGIDYLRYIEGEKHIIFVTEQGFQLPRAEHDRDLATMAADARVVIDTLQTGGVAVTGSGATIAVTGGVGLSALRTVSEITGGQVAVSQMADKAYGRILSSTEFGYLLGYTSNGPTPDGRPRSIKVEVKRRGAIVSHRRAYVARTGDVKYDPRQSLATTRLVSAASYSRDINDLRMSAKFEDVRSGAGRTIEGKLTVEADRLVFARAGSQYIAAINLVVFCYDTGGKTIGEVWASRDVRLSPAGLEDVRKNGLVIPINIAVERPPTRIRIIVYDYGSDLLGSMVKVMR
jgi:VWFA-related protein